MAKKINVRDALAIKDRDDVGQCRTCKDLALENEKYCLSCKIYWEECQPGLVAAEARFEACEDWG